MRLTRFLMKEEKSTTVDERDVLKSIKGGKFTVDGYDTIVDGDFHCDDFRLTSLEKCPGSIEGDFFATHNRLVSLEGIGDFVKEIKGVLDVSRNPITASVLGVLKIKGLNSIKMDHKDVEKIVNSYLPNRTGNKGVMACQSELLDAGFDDFAKL